MAPLGAAGHLGLRYTQSLQLPSYPTSAPGNLLRQRRGPMAGAPMGLLGSRRRPHRQAGKATGPTPRRGGRSDGVLDQEVVPTQGGATEGAGFPTPGNGGGNASTKETVNCTTAPPKSACERTSEQSRLRTSEQARASASHGRRPARLQKWLEDPRKPSARRLSRDAHVNVGPGVSTGGRRHLRNCRGSTGRARRPYAPPPRHKKRTERDRSERPAYLGSSMGPGI